MGQQQLLLIVLAIIIVGIAIAVSIGLFNANSEQSNRDALIGDLNNIAISAISYYKKPAASGGGGNTFTGWVIPPTLTTNSNGKFTATVKVQTIKLVGTGTNVGKDNKTKVKITANITPSSISITTNN